jgi:hypothetical protein
MMGWSGEGGRGRGVRIDVEEHAVGLSVSEALALRISFAGRTASGKGILSAGRVKIVGRGVLGVPDDATALGWCTRRS